MRKTYIVPSIRTVESETEELLENSGVHSNQGIKYGGVDEEGEVEAESRPMYNVWNE